MPCLNISTNVNLEGVDVEPIYSATTLALSSIIGRPSHAGGPGTQPPFKIAF